MRQMSLMNEKVWINCIFETIIKKWNLKLINEQSLKINVFNKINDVIINTYKMNTQIRDTRKRQYAFNQLFYFFQNTTYLVIMRLSWMMKTNFLIDWVTLTWRYIIIKNRMTLKTLENFIVSMNENTIVYALICFFESQKNELKKILLSISNFKNMFDLKSTNMLLTHDEHDHDIDLMSNKTSSYEFLYNMSQKKFETLREWIQKNFARDKIKHSMIDVETFVLFVLKKNEKFRLCVNYKDFNVITIKNKVSLSLINETLNRLINVAYFTKLDLKKTYHKIHIRVENEWKTTFRTRYKLFEYAMMSFDLINVSTIFQTLINKTLSDLIDQICVIYLNDILWEFMQSNEIKY